MPSAPPPAPAADDLGSDGYAAYNRRLQALRRSLGKVAFTTAWEEGHGLTWREAVALATTLSE